MINFKKIEKEKEKNELRYLREKIEKIQVELEEEITNLRSEIDKLKKDDLGIYIDRDKELSRLKEELKEKFEEYKNNFDILESIAQIMKTNEEEKTTKKVRLYGLFEILGIGLMYGLSKGKISKGLKFILMRLIKGG